MKNNTLLILLVCLIAYISSNQVELENSGDIGEGSDCGCSGSTERSSIAIQENVKSAQLSEVQSVEAVQSTIDDLNKKMVLISEGDAYIGTDEQIILRDAEGPRRKVYLNSYYIDQYEVSNDDFKKFVDATGFRSESESFGWSFVFYSAVPQNILETITQAVKGAEWWVPVNGSYWREPEGPGSDVFTTDRSNLPVVQVSWNDADAFCKWRGGRLPTEAEWETAASGPKRRVREKSKALFPWGMSITPQKTHRMNIFQGKFPTENTKEDGYEYMAPVDAYGPQNEYGVYNMIGNVWEWVHDWYTGDHSSMSSAHNPKGPREGTQKNKKGGSFLCHKSYCYRYRMAARYPSTPDSGTLNVGFRCAKDASTSGTNSDQEL